ncbi:zinc finger, CCHC-type containing protein [Tanacetum coccineum]
MSLVQLGSHLRIEESLRAQDSDKGKGKEVVGPSVNMIEEGKNKNNKQNKEKKHNFKERGSGSGSNKKPMLECWKCGKTGHFKRDCHSGFVYYNNGLFMLNLNKVLDDSDSIYMSSFAVVNFSLWHARLGHVHYKRMLEMSKDELIPPIDENLVKCCRAVVRLPDPKRKTLDEKGIDCIFVGYAEHSKAYKFYVIEPNDSVSINLIIESRDAIFDENRFSSIPRPKDIIPNSVDSQRDDHSDDVPSEIPEPRKEAIDDEIGSIMENNTWALSDLPPGCKPLGCKWIFKREMKVDGTIDKFKARLVIQGFRQKEGIDYFDTYAPIARITTIRLLLALAGIHNLVIHQMDVKTTFLNDDLDKEMYMKQPEGFVMPGNEHRVCKLVNSLYGLKQARKQWHQKFDEVVLSNGFLLNQSDKCVYSKFDSSSKGVIICLYVDDMLIFGKHQNQVDKTKKFLSSKFSLKDMGEADVIFGIKIKCENKGIVITQSHYIEKILNKFNREDCSPMSTPMDPIEKLKPNTGKPMDQLEYSRAIGCLMYAMTSTRPDIAHAVGTVSYGLSYVGHPLVLEAYLDASYINHVEDSSSTSGWVFLLGGSAISWTSKKQTCITCSIMESEFVALVATGKEAEWLRNLIHDIPIWPKPIAPISIQCDSAPKWLKHIVRIITLHTPPNYMGDDHFAPVHGKGSVVLEFSSGKSITLFNVLYVPKLRFGYYNNGMFMLNLNKVPDDSDSIYMPSSAVVNSSLWHARLRHVHYKRMLEMSKDELMHAIDENPNKCNTYRGGEYYDPVLFQSVGIIHETTTPYTPQQNSVAERKNRSLKGTRLPHMKFGIRNDPTFHFYDFGVHSKAYRFYVIEPNDSVSINLNIESRDAIFDENRFSSIPILKDIISNSDGSQSDDHSNVVPSEIPEPHKGKRVWKAKSYGFDFQLYLVEGSRDQVGSQYSYCYSIEEDPRTYNKAMQS